MIFKKGGFVRGGAGRRRWGGGKRQACCNIEGMSQNIKPRCLGREFCLGNLGLLSTAGLCGHGVLRYSAILQGKQRICTQSVSCKFLGGI